MKEDPKLKELKTNFEIIANEIKAMPECEKNEIMDKMYRAMTSLYNYIDYVGRGAHERIGRCEDNLYKHMDGGHLPPIKGAGKMEKVLKALDLDDDYQVIKPAIYSFASTVKGGLSIEAEYKKNN